MPPKNSRKRARVESVEVANKVDSTPNRNNVEADLSAFECPVCNEAFYSPIHQCSESHSICDGCYNKLIRKTCPSCNKLINQRNRTLEAVLESIKNIPCRHTDKGCKERMSLSAKRDHESKKCPFRLFDCFHDTTCSFNGTPAELVEHLKASHAYKILETNVIGYTCSLKDLELTEPLVWQKNIYHCHGEYFLLRISRQGGNDPDIRASLVNIGKKLHPYSLSSSASGIKFNYEGYTYPVGNGLTSGESIGACLTIKQMCAFFLTSCGWNKATKAVADPRSLTLTVTGHISNC